MSSTGRLRRSLALTLTVRGRRLHGLLRQRVGASEAFSTSTESSARLRWPLLRDAGRSGTTELAPPNADRRGADPKLIGRIEIPRLDLSVIIMDGDDEETLTTAAGHLRDTAMPWEGGNAAVAGHRDTFFRPLKDVRVGDEVRIVSRRGTFVYRVRTTRVVGPADVGILASEAEPTLTLVTCYPFHFVGNAPRRFIVRADLVATTPLRDEGR